MDENLHNNIDELFRDSLRSSRQDISGELWNHIEARLDEEDVKAVAAIRQRKTGLAAILLLFVLFAGGISVMQYNSKKSTKSVADRLATARRDFFSPKGGKMTGTTSGRENLRGDSTQVEQRFEKPFLKIAPEGFKINAVKMGSQKTNTAERNTDYGSGGESIPENESGESVTAERSMKKFPLHFAPAGPPPVCIGQKRLPEKSPLSEKMIVHLEKEKSFKRFSVTPYFSKEIAGYSLTDNDATAARGKEIEQRERNVFSASVGFYLNYRLNNKWTLQSGISYSWSSSIIDSAKSYATKDNTGKVQFKLNTISGYGYLNPVFGLQTRVGDSVSTAKSYSELHYVTVPLILSYRIPIKKFSLLLGGGVTFNMLTGASIETKTYGSGYPEKEYAVTMLGLKQLHYGVLVKADLMYSLSSRLGVNLITSFRNTLSPINLQSALSAYPYNLGIGLGVTYHF